MQGKSYWRSNSISRKGLAKFLGELQLDVMETVWERQPVTVSDVLKTLNRQKHNLAYTTVMTIMGRLAEKGWLTSEKRGRAFIYRAVHSREEAEASVVGEIVRALLRDFGEVAVAQFIKELDEIAPDELSHLSQLVHGVEANDSQ